MKKVVSLILSFLLVFSAFAVQIRNSGRNAVQYSLKNGNFPDEVRIGSDCYLDDFAFPYKNRKDEVVSVFVQQEKSFVYKNGDENNIQVAIKANSADFFPTCDVNYVLFISNPGFVATEKGRAVFADAVAKILGSKGSASTVCFYIAENEKFAFVNSVADLESILDEIALSEKPMDIADSLETIAKLSSASDGIMPDLPWKVLCVSEQDMFKNEVVEDSFFRLPFIYKNVSFAYLG